MRRSNRHVDETELERIAYWVGRYAEYLGERHRPVPPWAWLNAVAHGSEVLVVALTLTDIGGNCPEERRWAHARKLVAEEVVHTLTLHGCGLSELQDRLLVGLELELAAAEGWADLEPEDLHATAVEALHVFDRETHS